MKRGYFWSLIALLGAMAALMLAPSACASSKYFKPTSNKDMFKVTVEVTNFESTSGGTGSILHSSKYGSEILTNKHVCHLIEHGGLVDPPSHVKILVQDYKEDAEHDLCLIHVAEDLHINLKISDKAPELGDDIVVAGNPSLLPTVITRGHLSEGMVIPIQDGDRPCNDEDKKDPQGALICAMNNDQLPVIIYREAQLITATIMPGSSGSPVFSSKGEIIGVVFAGQQSLSYGLIVPIEAVWHFMAEAAQMQWSPAK
jgi:S1-C subfamily serine protease